jgi:polygalacturonase
MATNKTGVTSKAKATKKTPAAAKKTIGHVKPAAKMAAKATSKPATKKPKKSPKIKVVRDSFTMPQNEYKEIARIKDAFRKTGLPVKKSEVLRAGLKVLGKLNMAQMKLILAGLEKVKTGRPSKH